MFAPSMNQETLELLIDLHVRNDRQGPGSRADFMQALELSGMDTQSPLRVADIGCGTGATTLELLSATRASVTAVDIAPAFLERLSERAIAAGAPDRVSVVETDMADLPFTDGQFDAIWSEGAIYNIGFERGITDWKRYLKPGGILVVTEISWFSRDVPEELRGHWEAEYPEIALPSEKLRQLEEAGYLPIGYFPISDESWTEQYYAPLSAGFDDFLARHGGSDVASAIVKTEQQEMELYQKYKAYYGYGCYIAEKN
jgi:ubiquinone/menaquinone biosynthesis C-methylase UbiE